MRLGSDWDPVIGNWRVVNGHLTTDPEGDWRRIFVGDPGWSNYRINLDVWSDEWFYPIQVLVRVQDSGYLAMETNIHGTKWILVENGNEIVIGTSDIGINDISDGSRYESMYHLRIDAQDDIFTVYIDGLKVLQVQDSTFGWGRIGLAFTTPYESTWLDNVLIEPIY